MLTNQYTYSRLSSESVAAYVDHYYDLGVIHSCVFYVLGLHDNYVLESETGKFILRVYRNDWRNSDGISFELDLLNYLQNQNQSVAYPLLTNKKELAFSIESPEGERLAALFTYADGKGLNQEISLKESERLGTAVAQMHKAARGFKTSYQKKELNLDYLADQSVKLIKPLINKHQYELLKHTQEILHKNLSHLNPEIADFGICMGDVNQSNFHINETGKITLFDFDQCGYGYRAFELGKYLSSLHSSHSKKELMAAFLKGYETVRQINEVERKAIPYFEIASVIWVMSIRVANKNKVGYMNLEAPYWRQRLGIVKSLNEKLVH